MASSTIPRTLVVTGCDANHYDLAADLVESLRNACGARVEIGFINVGEGPAPETIRGGVDLVAEAPDPAFQAGALKGFRLAYLGVKARLPDLFPGYDVYVWLDADTWVQNPVGLEQIVQSAALADVCMHPEQDPNYYAAMYPHGYIHEVYRRLYGAGEADRYATRVMLNSGVLGARSSSPIWALWRAELEEIVARSRDDPEVYYSDQIPLHRLVMSGRLSVTPLRAVNNWLAGLCRPSINFSRRRLHAPTPPFEEINIIHLIGPSKDDRYGLGATGRKTTLRYRDIKALFAEADA